MIFETHTVPDSLNASIESIFYYNHFQPDHSIERVVPTGHLFLIFELDGIERYTYHNDTLKVLDSFRDCWLSGAHQNYLSISAHQDSEMLVVQFKPLGAYPFLKKSLNGFANLVVPATELFEYSTTDVRSAIMNSKSVKGKFSVVEDWLLKIYDPSLRVREATTLAFNELTSSAFSNYKSILKEYPNSQKHLIDQFKKHGGLTPKIYHRIFRFNEILQLVHQKKDISWTEVAYQCGYTDQSHFIKEFKTFSGFIPEQFVASKFHEEEVNFFPLDRKD